LKRGLNKKLDAEATAIRRSQVLVLYSKGRNETQIAETLNVSQPTVSLDIKYLMKESKEVNQKHIEERMQLEYRKCLVGLEDCIGRMTDIIEEKNADKKDIIAAVSVRMQAYKFKAEVLDSGIALNEVAAFIQKHKNGNNIFQGKGNTHQNGKVRIANNDTIKDAQTSRTD
jgi:orotate phosphoribosyltransferase-like protein